MGRRYGVTLADIWSAIWPDPPVRPPQDTAGRIVVDDDLQLPQRLGAAPQGHLDSHRAATAPQPWSAPQTIFRASDWL